MHCFLCEYFRFSEEVFNSENRILRQKKLTALRSGYNESIERSYQQLGRKKKNKPHGVDDIIKLIYERRAKIA